MIESRQEKSKQHIQYIQKISGKLSCHRGGHSWSMRHKFLLHPVNGKSNLEVLSLEEILAEGAFYLNSDRSPARSQFMTAANFFKLDVLMGILGMWVCMVPVVGWLEAYDCFR
jgi:hypothetical protein